MKVFIEHIIALFFAILCALQVSGQSNLRDLVPRQSNSVRKDIPVPKPKKTSGRESRTQQQDISPKSRVEAVKDTVYCFSVAKQHGWYKPLGILTKEQARHRRQSYMFTGKNDKGHWTKMESVDALGGHVAADIRPYIAKYGYERGTNKEWSTRLEGCCVYELIPDPSGDNIIQERAYDDDHNLIYAYSRVPIGDNQFIGSYTDYYGLPAEMRFHGKFSYGTLVRITEDDRGNDMRIEYIDSKGVSKPNADWAYAEVLEYYESGDSKSRYSVDESGLRTHDDWGNCGLESVYHGNHLLWFEMHTDEYGKPARLYSKYSGSAAGTIMSSWEYDPYFRKSSVIFQDEKCDPDVNMYGCHRIIYEYDNLGNLIRQTGYDLDGNFAAQEASGTAIFLYGYDGKGNMISAEYLDECGLPVSTPDYICRKEYHYDASGNRAAQIQWAQVGGEMKIHYLERTDTVDGCRRERVQWSDGSYREKRYDEKGREIFDGTFDSSGRHRPKKGDEWPFGGPTVDMFAKSKNDRWSYKTTDYFEIAPGKTEYHVSFYDETGDICPGLTDNKEVFVCDSLTKTKSVKHYRNDTIVSAFTVRYDTDFIKVLEMTGNNDFGVPSRAGSYRTRYYIAKPRFTPYYQGDINIMIGTDEFGEPDYIVSDRGVIYYYSRSRRLDWPLSMTTENEAIDSEEKNTELYDKLPKVMSIEVIDSCAYDLGIRDNDVILSYGSYRAALTDPLSDSDFRVDWTARNVTETGEPRDMVVFRVEDGPAGKFGLDTVRGLVGSPSELGFITHVRYLTQKQTARILGCRNGEEDNALEKERTRYVIVAYPEMFRSKRGLKYHSEIIDPSVFLGVCDVRHGIRLDYHDSITTDDLDGILITLGKDNTIRTEKIVYFTKDGKSTIDFTLAEVKNSGLNLIGGLVDDSVYEKLRDRYSAVTTHIDGLFAGISRIDPKLLCGYWALEAQDSMKYKPTGYLYLDRDGTCAGEITGFVYESRPWDDEVSDSPVYSVTRSLDGKWHEADNFISFQPLNIDNRVFGACVDIINPQSDRSVEYYGDDYLKYHKRFMSPLVDINNEAIVRLVDKHTLILEDAGGNEIRLVRQKGRPKVKK